MREIKFRAWDTKRKYMTEVLNIDLRIKIPLIHERYEDSINMVLMQFTGIIGKDKKEIYEGDIVKLYNHHQLEVVEYIGSAFGVFLYENKKRKSGNFQNMDEWCPISCPIEVVGNIYENSKLLEEK